LFRCVIGTKCRQQNRKNEDEHGLERAATEEQTWATAIVMATDISPAKRVALHEQLTVRHFLSAFVGVGVHMRECEIERERERASPEFCLKMAMVNFSFMRVLLNSHWVPIESSCDADRRCLRCLFAWMSSFTSVSSADRF
jgi:hypothetical protein